MYFVKYEMTSRHECTSDNKVIHVIVAHIVTLLCCLILSHPACVVISYNYREKRLKVKLMVQIWYRYGTDGWW